MRWHVMTALILLWVLMGCSRAASRTMQISLGDVFTLQQGQEAVIVDEGLHVRFDSVLEDSRCPTQVECFWTGQARIAVEAWQNGGTPVTLEFNTNPAPGQNEQTQTFSSYTIRLESLYPYPQTSEESIEKDDYRANLQISQGVPAPVTTKMEPRHGNVYETSQGLLRARPHRAPRARPRRAA